MTPRKNVFVIGLDDFHLAELRTVRNADDYNFEGLLDYDTVVSPRSYDLDEWFDRAYATLDGYDGSVDAIVGYWDFPTSTMLPVLRRRYGLAGPSLESVLKCEHKYWSRVQQREVMPEDTPAFGAVDPFDPEAGDRLEVPYPFWLKPIKAFSSHLGFRINGRAELEKALAEVREHIGRLAEPFNYMLGMADIPPEIARVDGYHCIAEELISSGQQVTLEGYMLRGEFVGYGFVDSIREGPTMSSFGRYQYPSALPAHARERMLDMTERFMRHIGFDNSPFNIEFFYDPSRDRVRLLEVNTRISKSHCPLFELVDGASHQEVMVEVALGIRPHFPRRAGPYRLAAKFMPRVYEDGIVTRVPDATTLARVRNRFRHAVVHVHVREGMRLSDLPDQDSYSFELADVFLGARDQRTLLDKYRRLMAQLPFEFRPTLPSDGDTAAGVR